MMGGRTEYYSEFGKKHIGRKSKKVTGYVFKIPKWLDETAPVRFTHLEYRDFFGRKIIKLAKKDEINASLIYTRNSFFDIELIERLLNEKPEPDHFKDLSLFFVL